MTSTSGRAAPLPPDERRAAILAATLPLVRRHGAAVSTRQIAEAAGVAEGTIFRVFPDKESVIREAVATAFDPAPAVADLQRLDRTLALDDRLLAVVEIGRARLENIWGLLSVLGMHQPPEGVRPGMARRPHDDAFTAAVAELVAPDHALLREPPAEVARRLRMLIVACTHPMITGGDPLTATEIVSLLLDGVRRPTPTGET